MGTPRIDRIDRNHIINGAFDFWQRASSYSYGGTGAIRSYFGPDRFASSVSTTNSRSGPAVTRSTSVPSLAQSGFNGLYSFQYTQNNTLTLINSDYFVPLQYVVEGYDYARLHGGKSVCLNFWFKSTITGLYPISLQSGAGRAYVTQFNYTTANTWQYIAVPFLTDTTGGAFDNGAGLYINILPQAVASLQTNTLGSWQTSAAFATSSGVQILANASLVFNITQISLTEGPGLDSTSFSRAGRSIGDELRMCQRYYEKSYDLDVVPGTATSGGRESYTAVTAFHRHSATFRTTKRSTPTLGIWSVNGVADTANRDAGTTTPIGSPLSSAKGFSVQGPSHTGSVEYGFNWSADAEI